MGYVGQLSDGLEPVRNVLRRADESAATAPTNRAVREKLQAQLRRLGGQLEVYGQMAARVLVEIDVLDLGAAFAEQERVLVEQEIEGEHSA